MATPMTTMQTEAAVYLVQQNIQVRFCGLGRARYKERIGKLAVWVWDYCERQDANFSNKLALNKEGCVDECVAEVKAAENKDDLIGFIPLAIIFGAILKVIISLLIDYWLLNKGQKDAGTASSDTTTV